VSFLHGTGFQPVGLTGWKPVPLRNPESGARASQKTGMAAAAALNEVKGLGAAVVPSLRSGRQEPLRAAATRENDKQEIQQDRNRHHDMQDS